MFLTQTGREGGCPVQHDQPRRVISECPMRDGGDNQGVWVSECPATAGQLVHPEMGDIDPKNMVNGIKLPNTHLVKI